MEIHKRGYHYSSSFTYYFSQIIVFLFALAFYAWLGSAGTAGIAILLLWIVYKFEKYNTRGYVYRIYDVVNKKEKGLIDSKQIFSKGEIINLNGGTPSYYYVEEVLKSVTLLKEEEEESDEIYTRSEGCYCFAWLKCRPINDFSFEDTTKPEQIAFSEDEEPLERL